MFVFLLFYGSLNVKCTNLCRSSVKEGFHS